MNETGESNLELNQEPKKNLDPDFKNQIKKEMKEEMKQEFFHYKKKKYLFYFSFLIVFLIGIGIGFFAGHHDHGFRHGGYMMQGGQQMEMQRGMHMGTQRYKNQNGVYGE